jgi:membrane protein DedA with SNARE-associated domain
MYHSISDALLHLFENLSYAGVAIAMAIESCCIPLPSELIMPLAGFLSSQGKLNLVGATFAGAVGCVIGSSVAYWIGALGGRPLLLRYGRYILISHHDAERADEYFARYGDATIFLTRMMPIVRTFISLPAGIARMNFTRFVIYTFLGSLPWCFVLAYAGYKLGQHWGDVGSTLHKYDILVGVIIVVLVGLFLYYHLGRRGRRGDTLRGDDARGDAATTGGR